MFRAIGIAVGMWGASTALTYAHSFLFPLVHSSRAMSVNSEKFCLSEHYHSELWVHGGGTSR